MPSINSYREVKIQQGSRIDQIKNFEQRDWIKACERLGLNALPDYGKGSHCAVYKDTTCPPNKSDCCVLTIPKNLYQNIQRDLFKKILFYGLQSGKYTEEEIWKALGK